MRQKIKKELFFSLIIPVYNTRLYIAQCLQSCIRQTFEDIEIIVVDDCGSDGAIEIAKEFAKKDSRIKIIHNPHNLGLFHTRANGVANAQGQYCLFVDSDDFLQINTCKTLYVALKRQNKKVDLLHFGMQYFPKTHTRITPKISPYFLANQSMQNFLILNNTFQSLWGKAIETSILQNTYKKMAFLDRPLGNLEDGIIILILSFEIKTYYGIKEKLYFYRNNPDSMTRTISIESFFKKSKDFDYLFEILQKIKILYPEYMNYIQAYEKKVASATILDCRMYSKNELTHTIKILKKHHFKKRLQSFLPAYLSSSILSLRYFYRWQTLARIGIYLFSFGKIKL